VAVLGAFALLVQCSPESRANPGGPALRYDLTLDKDKYEVGEPIELNVRLTNVGDVTVEIPHSSEVTGRHDGYSFVVRDEKGAALKDPMHEEIWLLHSLGSSWPVRPGDSRARTLTLNFRVPPLRPGKYTVQGVFQPRSRGQDIKAESPSVPFQIVDTPPASLERRVARLAQALRDGGDARRIAPLLGFTGHTAALAPLIDTLYRKDDHAQVAAFQALLYLDHASVKAALLESLKARGPRDRMIHLLAVRLQAKPEEVTPFLLKWLEDEDGDTRYAAVEGLYLSNRAKDPKLFPHLESRLKDPLPRVRSRAAAAVGGYQNAAALKALKTVVKDPDQGVSEQATIAVGWVAKTAAADSPVRKEATDLLREMLQAGGGPGRQAVYWLEKIGDK
jgi:HEAT repeat protein